MRFDFHRENSPLFDRGEPFNRRPSKQKHGRLIPYGAFKPCRIKGRRSKSFRLPSSDSPAKETRGISFDEGEGSQLVHRLWDKLVVCCWKITGIAKEGKEEAPRRLDAGLPLLYRRLLASLVTDLPLSRLSYISLSIVFPWWPVTSHFARTVF